MSNVNSQLFDWFEQHSLKMLSSQFGVSFSFAEKCRTGVFKNLTAFEEKQSGGGRHGN